MRIFFFREIIGLTDISSSLNFFYFILDLVIPYILFSVLATFILIPIILHKGIVFNFLGYTLFYWFLFFPLHILLGVIKDEAWTQSFRLAIIILAVILIVIFAASLFYFPNRIKKVNLTFMTSKIKRKTRIVHLSDIHAENYGLREAKLISIVNKLKADIILITGDIFIVPFKYNTRSFNAAVKIIEQLKAKYSISIVEGHHDIGKTNHIAEILKDKVKLLKDEWYHFTDYGITLSIFGAMLHTRKNDFAENSKLDNFRIFFAHGPTLIKNLKSGDFDLALFGHTHACQVYIPFISYLIVGKYRHGLYNYNGIPFYVNAGIGLEGYLAPRIRWFTFPEVVIIDLIPVN